MTETKRQRTRAGFAETETLVEDSDRAPLTTERRSGEHRRFFRFDPTVSTGTLMQLGGLLAGFAIAYGTYRADQTQTKADIEAVRTVAETNRIAVKEDISRITSDVGEIKRTMNAMSLDVARLQAQGAVAVAPPARPLR